MNFPDFSLTGQIALVTGARRGIGKAIALAFAKAGADVAVCDLVADDGLLASTGEEIRKLGHRALTIKADTSQESDIKRLVEQVAGEWGTIDVLVNNAGINIPGPFMDIAADTWDKVMNVNVRGYFLMSQAVSRIMVAHKKGSIISMSSRFAFRTLPNIMLYSISKAAVVQLTKSMAVELGKHGIRVNALAPGMIKTDFNRKFWENEDFVAKHNETVPAGRLGEVTDVVGAALYLASPASSYVNGHILVIDGASIC